jgi:hypothetical protein
MRYGHVRRTDVSLKTTSICVVEAGGSAVWEGRTESEPLLLVKALLRWHSNIRLVGIEACPCLNGSTARSSKAASIPFA